MIVKLLTEYHLEFLNLKGGCRGSSLRVYTCQNVILLEISCHGSFTLSTKNVVFLDYGVCEEGIMTDPHKNKYLNILSVKIIYVKTGQIFSSNHLIFP